MNWKPWLLLIFAIPLSGAVILFFGKSIFPERPEETIVAASGEERSIDTPLISFVDPWKGAENPRVTIVEYGDYGCPYCRETEKVIDRVLAERDDVRFVWKDLPSSLHLNSDDAAEAAHCAKDQGKFWEYHRELFAQGEIINQTSLALIANDVGLDLERFSNCLSSGKKKPLIEKSVSEARALGIDGTPYFFIEGKRYSGQMGYEELLRAIE